MRRSDGFTVVEALVAMIIVAFGMLALGGLQVSLTRSSDLARQRAEATRLSQQKMEQLRAYGTIAVTSGYSAWNDLAGSSDSPSTSTNTSFTRTWTVGGTIDDWQRPVVVTVAWNDRAGESQSVTINSTISQTDPAGVGALNVPTVEDGILRRPKARDINIPIPSVSLGGTNAGKSKVQFGASGGWLVFDNNSGDVVYKCTTEPTDSTNLSSSCAALTAFLLSGYITGDVAFSNNTKNYMNLAISTGKLTIADKLSIVFSATSGISGTPDCIVADARDQNTGATIAGYGAYTCLIQLSSTVTKRWTATVTVNPAPTGSNQVCRFTTGTTANADHPSTYSNVTETLDNQNYAVVQGGSGSCLTGSRTP